MRLRPFAAFALALWLAACQAAERPAVTLRRDFAALELERIGAYDPAYAEFGDTAALNALNYALRAGAPREALERLVVAPVLSEGLTRRREASDRPVSYDLWLYIKSCDSPVYMKASSLARLLSVRDRAGCLSGLPPSGSTDY